MIPRIRLGCCFEAGTSGCAPDWLGALGRSGRTDLAGGGGGSWLAGAGCWAGGFVWSGSVVWDSVALRVWQKTAVVVRQISRQAMAKCVRFKLVLAPIQVIVENFAASEFNGWSPRFCVQFPPLAPGEFPRSDRAASEGTSLPTLSARCNWGREGRQGRAFPGRAGYRRGK